MWERLLLAMDEFDTGQVALDFTRRLTTGTDTEVRVLHVRELPANLRVPPLETADEAEHLVEEAVLSLRLAGVGTEGRSCSHRSPDIARRIVEEAGWGGCDAIVLGSRRLRGFNRVFGRGVREGVFRLSPLPVLTAPAPVTHRRHRAPSSERVPPSGR